MSGYKFVAVLAIAASAANADAQNLITNHSFESPPFNPSFPPLLADGWYSDLPSNMYIDTSQATDGTQYQQTGGSLEQNTGVAVTPGAIYRLQFDFVSFTDDPSGPAFAQLYTNPNVDNDGIDPGNAQLFSQALPTGPTSTILPQSFDITAPPTATGFVYLRFLTGHNYRGIDNVRLTVVPGVDADFDGDNDVDGNDFLIWQRGVGTPSPTPMQGNANGDAAVDGADLDIWKTQFGTGTAVAAASAIPEPASAMLLIFGSALALASHHPDRRDRGRDRQCRQLHPACVGRSGLCGVSGLAEHVVYALLSDPQQQCG